MCISTGLSQLILDVCQFYRIRTTEIQNLFIRLCRIGALLKFLEYTQRYNPNVPAVSMKLFSPAERESLERQTSLKSLTTLPTLASHVWLLCAGQCHHIRMLLLGVTSAGLAGKFLLGWQHYVASIDACAVEASSTIQPHNVQSD